MSKVNILRTLLASRPVRTAIDFGIHDNVRLTAIDNTPRKRDGETIQKQCFLTFTKYNSKDESIAQSEFSYFTLKHDSDYTGQNLSTQLAQLTNLITVMNPDALEKFGEDFNGQFDSLEELQEALSNKKALKTVSDNLFKYFAKAVKKFVGAEAPLMRLKVVTDRKTGKWNQLPDDANIVESMDVTLEDTVLAITAFEKKNKAKSLSIQTEKADSTGGAPDKATSTSNIIDI